MSLRSLLLNWLSHISGVTANIFSSQILKLISQTPTLFDLVQTVCGNFLVFLCLRKALGPTIYQSDDGQGQLFRQKHLLDPGPSDIHGLDTEQLSFQNATTMPSSTPKYTEEPKRAVGLLSTEHELFEEFNIFRLDQAVLSCFRAMNFMQLTSYKLTPSQTTPTRQILF